MTYQEIIAYENQNQQLSYQDQINQLKIFECDDQQTISDNEQYFLMSVQWIKNFKQNQQDIYDPFNEDLFILVEQEYQLKQGLIKNQDYYVYSKKMMELISKHHQGKIYQISIFNDENQQQFIDLYPIKINLIFINNQLLKLIDTSKVQQFQIQNITISSQFTFLQLFQKILELSKKFNQQFQQQNSYYNNINNDQQEIRLDNIRLWKIMQNLQEFFNELKVKCNHFQTYNYRIVINEKLLEIDFQQQIQNLQLNQQFIFVEIRTDFQQWQLIKQGEQEIDSCECCRKFITLTHQCNCLKVKYCSENCKQRDYQMHQDRCDYIEPENEEIDFQIIENNKYGLVGLQNIGNTCYMNSALQCLSHTIKLTEYFFSKKYLQEINLINNLGHQGKVANSYAKLLKNLWRSDKDIFVPKIFKRVLQNIFTQYQGYQQHDSLELLSYILDGLHEDLNRVINKPYTSSIGSNDRPDYLVAQESWDNYLKRNQSIIVDLMHGQFRSNIQCSQCKIISKCFDPFMFCQLPIPQQNLEKIGFYYLFKDNRNKAYKINLKFQADANQTTAHLKNELSQLMGINQENFCFAFLSYKKVEQIIEDNLSIASIKQLEQSRNLFALEITEEDRNIPKEDLLIIPVRISKLNFNNSQYDHNKEAQTFVRPFYWNKNMTLKDIHIKIFEYQKFLYEEQHNQGEDIKQLNTLEAFEKLILGQSNDYKIIVNYKSNEQFYLNEENADCQIEIQYTDQITLEQFISQIPQEKFKDIQFMFEIIWQYKNYDLSRFNNCVDFQKKQEFKSMEKNIYDCFDIFTQKYLLENKNQWYCSKCKIHLDAEKKMDIYKAPEILIIQLKRFKMNIYNAEKNNLKIDFPIKGLNLSKYILQKQQPNEMELEQEDEHIYDLYAVTNHYGPLGHGHYTAHAYNEHAQNWFLFDDSIVTLEPNPEKIVSEAAYILFYKKRNQ